jgi:hypothetical protein
MLRSLSLTSIGIVSAGLLFACGGGGDDDDDDGPLPPLFEPKPECAGESIAALAGQHQQIISSLEIGDAADGFDLDGDGKKDNKLAGVAALAGPAIADAIKAYDLLIPMEMFDFTTPGADPCVKFALYLGKYKQDKDGDDEDTAVEDGDCNDGDVMIPADAEVAGNLKDDDCDGLADEQNDGDQQTPSANTVDADGDGLSPAAGDCDDTRAMVKTGLAEVCGDGLDNDCDGVADRTEDAQGAVTACNPLDASPDTIELEDRSFGNDGKPLIAFTSGAVSAGGGGLQLVAGPSLFQVSVPITDGIELTLKVTGTTIEANVAMEGNRVIHTNGRLGGVIDARTADTIRGLEVEEIGLSPENSLLDAIFANVLGPLLALPVVPGEPMCRTPDIDVDRDGLEAFCDKNLDGDPNTQQVDTCIDGDGTVVQDTMVGGVIQHCADATDGQGRPRFPDGVSVEFNFATSPANLVRP